MKAVPHGIMFHHFFDQHHPRGQGALSQDEFAAMIDFLGRDRILPAQEWKSRALEGRLEEQDLCITFDDALRCQIDVAKPVLDGFGLTAFWFVFTSPLEGTAERLEVYRYYRTVQFETVEEYYSEFLVRCKRSRYQDLVESRLKGFDPKSHLSEFPFYTDEDRLFRYVRDDVLGVDAYNEIMDAMVLEAGLNPQELLGQLWFDRNMLQQLHEEGHVLGLHSHTHPTRLGELERPRQAFEYKTNSDFIRGCIGEQPETMSHPCCSYNDDTLEILQELGVKLGFRANMAGADNSTRLEFPREDHANVLRMMRDESYSIYQ